MPHLRKVPQLMVTVSNGHLLAPDCWRYCRDRELFSSKLCFLSRKEIEEGWWGMEYDRRAEQNRLDVFRASPSGIYTEHMLIPWWCAYCG